MGMGRVQMLASTADRDRAVQVLKAAFVEGRISQEELRLRVGKALTARLFPDVMAVIHDLPVSPIWRMPAHRATPAPPRFSRLAIAALVCAIAGPCTAGFSAVPAIVLGCMARRRVRRTGERGAAMATAALVLGWMVVLIGGIVLAVRLQG
jgi:hypothetical protein